MILALQKETAPLYLRYKKWALIDSPETNDERVIVRRECGMSDTGLASGPGRSYALSLYGPLPVEVVQKVGQRDCRCHQRISHKLSHHRFLVHIPPPLAVVLGALPQVRVLAVFSVV